MTFSRYGMEWAAPVFHNHSHRFVYTANRGYPIFEWITCDWGDGPNFCLVSFELARMVGWKGGVKLILNKFRLEVIQADYMREWFICARRSGPREESIRAAWCFVRDNFTSITTAVRAKLSYEFSKLHA